MANYFRCDTTKVKNSNAGGRLFSGKLKEAKEIPNGMFAFMGGYVEGEDEIRELSAPTTELIKAEIPVLIHKPEINYKEESATDAALGIYRNRAGQILRVFPMEKWDEITLSEDFFDKTGKGNSKIEVGDVYTLQANMDAGRQLKYASAAPNASAARVYFKVTKVANSHTPVFLGGDGQMFPQAYKLIDIEICINEPVAAQA